MGVYGLKTLKWNLKLGELHSPAYPKLKWSNENYAWKVNEINTAWCGLENVGHCDHIPCEKCKCGFYAHWDKLTKYYTLGLEMCYPVYFIVSVSGKLIPGDFGFRS